MFYFLPSQRVPEFHYSFFDININGTFISILQMVVMQTVSVIVIPETARSWPTSLDEKLSPPYFLSLMVHNESI
jgi:hypothetical protein